MKRIAAVLLVLSVVGALAGAAQARPELTVPTRTPNTLTIGFDPAAGFVEGSGKSRRGLEVDVAKAIAARLGIAKLKWIRTGFKSIFTAGEKRYDFALAQASITPERKKAVDFTVPYFFTNLGVLVKLGQEKPASLAALRQLQMCTQAGTTSAKYLRRKLKPALPPLELGTVAETFAALTSGQCAAVVLDLSLVSAETNEHPSLYGPIAGQIVTNEGYGAVFQKGSALRSYVNNAISALRANGTLAQLAKKWAAQTGYVGVPTLK